jgi:hypothetical protein
MLNRLRREAERTGNLLGTNKDFAVEDANVAAWA